MKQPHWDRSHAPASVPCLGVLAEALGSLRSLRGKEVMVVAFEMPRHARSAISPLRSLHLRASARTFLNSPGLWDGFDPSGLKYLLHPRFDQVARDRIPSRQTVMMATIAPLTKLPQLFGLEPVGLIYFDTIDDDVLI